MRQVIEIGDNDKESDARSLRVLAYCHDGVGLGHLSRTLKICEHAAKLDPRMSFLIVTGSPYISLFEHGRGIDFVKLPALAKIDNRNYRPKYLPLPVEELLVCRESLILNVVKHFEPDVVLVDKAPVGVCGELVPAIRWIREHRPTTRLVFGMRDIEDDAESTIEQWLYHGVQNVLEACYDEIWVYGMRRLYDVVREYDLSPSIQRKLDFVGYIAKTECGHPQPETNGQRELLVTVGGGTDGETLLDVFLTGAARKIASKGVHSTVVGGPDLPHPVADRLRRQAAELPNVDWLDVAGCMNCRIRRADLVLTMGGYNTLCEIATNRKPALVVPRCTPRLEQTIRARLWQRHNIVRSLDQSDLTADSLASGLIEMLDNGPTRTEPALDMGGLRRVAARFQAFKSKGADRAVAVRL